MSRQHLTSNDTQSHPMTASQAQASAQTVTSGRIEYDPVLAIIPARYGSKGLPKKNLRELGGKPLVAWSIEQALSSPGIGKVIVSTDSEEIAEVSRSYGAEVPFIRPPELSGDTSLVGSVISHAKSHIINSGYAISAALTLYPSHPFRTLDMFTTAIKALTVMKCSSFKTVKPIHMHPETYVKYEGKTVSPMALNMSETNYYRCYGLIVGQAHPTNFGPEYVYPLNYEPGMIDIDEEQDLIKAQELLDRGLYDFHA